ncbi:MAG: molybdate ABC transporter substrate-binding protein [Bacteroidota bacterium]
MRGTLGAVLLLLVACQPATEGIKVAVAANLLLPLEEIVASYEQKHTEKVLLIPGASGSLMTQIENGAPFDLFISANERFAKHLHQKERLASNPKNLIQGRLLLWRKADLPNLALDNELDAGVKVAIADPELAPYGAAAKEYLIEQGLWEAIQPNLVVGKSVGQVNQYLRAAVVDYAFTAPAAQSIDSLLVDGHWQSLSVSIRLDHPFMLLKEAKPEAQLFMDYLEEVEALAIFSKHGYLLKR